MEEKYILKIQENEDRSKSNQRRIEDLEEDAKSNNKLVSSVEKLTLEIKYMREDYQKLAKQHTEEVKAIDSRLKEVENKPAKRWNGMVDKIIDILIGAFMGYILIKLGL